MLKNEKKIPFPHADRFNICQLKARPPPSSQNYAYGFIDNAITKFPKFSLVS